MLERQLKKYKEIENDILNHFEEGAGDLISLVQKMMKENSRLKETLNQRERSVQEVIEEYETKLHELE